MGKTTFKTFIYSFTLSLFAIFVVNRVFLSTPKTSEKYIYTNKNITLFLKDSKTSSFHASAAPAKKIVLSNLNDIISADKTSFIPEKEIVENETKFSTTNNTEKKILDIQKLAQKKSLIPLEISAQEISLSETKAKPKKTKDNEFQIVHAKAHQKASANEENSSDADNSIVESKKVVYQTEQPSLKTPEQATETSLNKEKQNDAINKEIVLPKQQEKISNTPTQIAKKEENKDISKKIIVSSTDHEPQMLIPLEGNVSEKFAHAEVKSAQDASANAVAFNAKDTPISSMKTVNAADKNSNKDNSSKKNWQQMKEKEPPSDDPWVVAKGKSHPNNQMILEDKKYTISDNEVEKIFSQKNTQSSEEELLLAAKTVKNLLIPIPEDILNDENLTPQLISSPKNKEIKEELESKGLIIKETPPQEAEAEAEDKTSEALSKENAENSTKESGILNSITSLFSGGDKQEDTLEIGVNETEEEETNSLFSAFTRKQNKLMSKILPTEIRLSFQPNRAEISGQTLKWIKAFAQKTAEEPTTGLEIRIDGTSSPLLQRRRLNLLQNILLNEGAIPEKINTVFTSREPNSFILRTVRLNNEMINTTAKNNNRYMQW